MSVKSPESMMQDEREKRRLLDLLVKIANSADCGLYYEYTAKELKEKMRDIQAITAEALSK